MSTSSVLLASAGEDVRCWTMPDLTLASVKNGTNANVVSCSCSPNGQLVAYAHEDEGLTVASLNDESSPFIKIPTTCEQSSVMFNGSSRFLLTGGHDSVVNIWDIKSRVAKRTYKEHVNPIAYCIFNHNDTVMATASNKGEVILINVQSGLASDPMLGKDSQVVREMGYSYFHRTTMATVSDSGAVTIWDTKEKKLLHTFNEHKSPGTGLSFSPVNDMLMCSTGLDKRIIFYDVLGKKMVKTINTEGPVTCCDFMFDGGTIAVGSASGRIYLFDLRKGSTPIKVVHAHKTSIRNLSFQKVPKDKSKKPLEESKSISESMFSRVRQESSSSDKDLYMNGVAMNKDNITRESSFATNREPSFVTNREPSFATLEDFANKMPVKENSTSLLMNRENSSAALRYALSRNKIETQTPPPKAQKILGDDVFTPISVDQTIPKKLAGKQKSTPKRDKIRQASTAYDEDSELRPDYPRSKSSLSKFNLTSKSTDDIHTVVKKLKEGDKDSTDSGKKGVLNFKSPFKKKNHHIKTAFNYNKHSDESETSSIDSFSLDRPRGLKDRSSDRSTNSAEKSISTGRLSPYRQSNEVDRQKSPSIHSGDFVHVYPNGDVPMTNGFAHPAQYQSDFIQKMIDEAMEENRVAVHNDMVNLQVEMLRQLEIQKEQIRQMLQEYSINDDLVSEIKRLRAENERLRTKY